MGSYARAMQEFWSFAPYELPSPPSFPLAFSCATRLHLAAGKLCAFQCRSHAAAASEQSSTVVENYRCRGANWAVIVLNGHGQWEPLRIC